MNSSSGRSTSSSSSRLTSSSRSSCTVHSSRPGHTQRMATASVCTRQQAGPLLGLPTAHHLGCRLQLLLQLLLLLMSLQQQLLLVLLLMMMTTLEVRAALTAAT